MLVYKVIGNKKKYICILVISRSTCTYTCTCNIKEKGHEGVNCATCGAPKIEVTRLP